jgi:hypothetical protein
VPTCRIQWPQAWRVIASRYPPINLFDPEMIAGLQALVEHSKTTTTLKWLSSIVPIRISLLPI